MLWVFICERPNYGVLNPVRAATSDDWVRGCSQHGGTFPSCFRQNISGLHPFSHSQTSFMPAAHGDQGYSTRDSSSAEADHRAGWKVLVWVICCSMGWAMQGKDSSHKGEAQLDAPPARRWKFYLLPVRVDFSQAFSFPSAAVGLC